MNKNYLFLGITLVLSAFSCKKASDSVNKSIEPPAPSCMAANNPTSIVSKPQLLIDLKDRWHAAWQASPAIADINNDGTKEILVARANLMIGWHLDGTIVFKKETAGRIWSSPIVADLSPSIPGLEIAVASKGFIYVWDKDGNDVPGFPVNWRDELRSLAAADIDGDGQFELVAVTTNKLSANGQNDIIIAYKMNGAIVSGFPPNTTGTSGADAHCYQTGGYDQNVALGDVNNDGIDDIFVTQDNAFLSLHEGNGRAFDSNPFFMDITKFLGVRFLLDYAVAKRGWSDNVNVDLQAHFTNSAPAIADVDGDGTNELIVLGSVQNSSQTDRLKGVALWVLENDGSRTAGWEEPFYVPSYLAGLSDLNAAVAATNQVSVADFDLSRPGPEMIFAGFDGKIHAVDASRNEMWNYTYTTNNQVLTSGVALADLTSDGATEIIFTTYSTQENQSHLFILDGGGNEKQKISLPKRGATPVPTIDDVNGDGQLEIIVSLKDGEDNIRMVQVYTVPGSSTNCMLWPTGRGNYLRNGYLP
jgi:hypothetical protein